MSSASPRAAEDYDALLALARKSTETNERVRYYYAAASARDGALAQDTLALTLTKELPSTLVNGLINEVAQSGLAPRAGVGVRAKEPGRAHCAARA